METPTFDIKFEVTEGGKKAPQYTINSNHEKLTLEELVEYARGFLIVTADTVLKDEQSRGFDMKPVLIVDNKKNKPIQQVKPFGQIEFVARQQMSTILLEAYEALLYRSKVRTGKYKSSHLVFHNGKQVASDTGSLQSWISSEPKLKSGDIVRIVNVQPYARRLERYGVTAQRTSTRREDSGRRKKKLTGNLVQIPNGTYYLTARAIRNKYKKNSIISFKFISGSSLGISASFAKGRGRTSTGRPYLYPSLSFIVDERGTL